MNLEQFPTFNKLYGEAGKAYAKKDFELAYNIMDKIATDFPTLASVMALEKAQLLCCLDKCEEAIQLLITASEKEDFWYIDSIFDMKDFKPIKNDPRISDIRDVIKERLEVKSQGEQVIYFYPKNKPIKKLLVLLHGNHFLNPSKLDGKMESEMSGLIQSLINEEATLCYVYSSRLGYFGFPFWYDFEQGAYEVGNFLKNIQEKHNISNENLYVYGISAGAGVLLSGVTDGLIKAKNIGLLVPALLDLNNQKETLLKLDENKHDFFVYSGTKDHCLKYAEGINKILDETKIKHTILVEEDQNHRFVKGFNTLVKESWKFFNKN